MEAHDSSPDEHPFPGSRLRVHREGDRLVIDVPPTGPFHPVPGFLLVFAVFFSPAPAFVVACFVNSLRQGFHSSDIGPMLLLFPFLPVGILCWLIAIHWMIRRATVVVTDDWLGIIRKGVLPQRRMLWHRTALAAISVGNSRYSLGNRVLPELQIRPRRGRLFRALAGLPGKDLQWLADLLFRELRLSELPEPAPEVSGRRLSTGRVVRHVLFSSGGGVFQAFASTVFALLLWALWSFIFSHRVFALYALPWWLGAGAVSGLLLGSARQHGGSHFSAAPEVTDAG